MSKGSLGHFYKASFVNADWKTRDAAVADCAADGSRLLPQDNADDVLITQEFIGNKNIHSSIRRL